MIISFLALLVGTLFFYLDYSQYPPEKPALPPPPAAGGGGAPPGK